MKKFTKSVIYEYDQSLDFQPSTGKTLRKPHSHDESILIF